MEAVRHVRFDHIKFENSRRTQLLSEVVQRTKHLSINPIYEILLMSEMSSPPNRRPRQEAYGNTSYTIHRQRPKKYAWLFVPFQKVTYSRPLSFFIRIRSEKKWRITVIYWFPNRHCSKSLMRTCGWWLIFLYFPKMQCRKPIAILYVLSWQMFRQDSFLASMSSDAYIQNFSF